MSELVYYVSYGSNMAVARFTCYLAGGTPPGATRGFPGCRDTTPPRDVTGCGLCGGVYFATRSPVWGGGRAFYDRELTGTVAARAYLITAQQFADVQAQEMYREPGMDLDLRPVLTEGRARLGEGRYETLVLAGERNGYPLLTFTSPWRADEVELVAPSAAYLRMLTAGLREAHGWDVARCGRYLAELPGVRGTWTAEQIAAL